MPSPGVSSVSIRHTRAPGPGQLEVKLSPFDQHHYQSLIRAREEAIRKVLRRLNPALGLKTALDAGAGVGFFSQTLADCGLSVRGFDGRAENVAEARKRFPHIAVALADLEDPTVLSLGKFDFVVCFGLLYHLENPLLAVRHLRALTEKCLLLESMCVPDDKPSMLLREEPSETDQGLTDVACYPSEDSLIKMLYRAGFGFVYRLAPLPKHDDFRETFEHRRQRTVLLGSAIPIALVGIRLCIGTYENQDPWTKVSAFPGTIPQRISRFLALPAAKKYLSLAYHARRILPGIPIPR
jgi:SAM-dependent methyltransferase